MSGRERERDLQHAVDEALYCNDGGERLLQAIAVYAAAGNIDEGSMDGDVGRDDEGHNDGRDDDVGGGGGVGGHDKFASPTHPPNPPPPLPPPPLPPPAPRPFYRRPEPSLPPRTNHTSAPK